MLMMHFEFYCYALNVDIRFQISYKVSGRDSLKWQQNTFNKNIKFVFIKKKYYLQSFKIYYKIQVAR